MRVRKATLVAVLLATLVVTSGIALANARGKPVLSVHAPDNEFAPGEDAEFDILVQNAGEVAYASSSAEASRVTLARDVVVTLDADDAPIDVEAANGEKPAGNIAEGVSEPITYSISVDEGAEPGTYELPVTVEYTHTQVIGREGAYNERDETIRRSVTIEIEDDANFRVVSASAQDLFGGSGPVTLTLENTGSATAYDANVAVQSGSAQLTFGGEGTAGPFVGEWAPGETREVSLEGTLAEGADRRSYPLTATVNYDDADGDSKESDAMNVGVTPRVESRFDVTDVESTLAVGEEGSVTGTLVNNGGSTARNAVLVLSADTRNFEPIETEYAIGDLEAGASEPFTFDAEVSEAGAGGPRQLSFSVRYRNGDNSVVESDPIDARVDVGPSRDTFAVDPVAASVQTGSSGELRLEVTNTGDEPVTDVSAKLFANSPLSTDDDEAFVDRLGPGESQTIVFGISSSGSALNKTYPVSLDFQYDDADGDTLISDTYQVPVQVTEPTDEGGPPIPLILGVLVVLAAAAYLLNRRIGAL